MFRSGIPNRPHKKEGQEQRTKPHIEDEKFKPVFVKMYCDLGLSAPCSCSALLIILPGMVVCLLGFKILFPRTLVETYYACSPGFTEALSAFKTSCIPPSCSCSYITSSSSSPEASIRGWSQGTHTMPSKSCHVTSSHYFLGTRSHDSHFAGREEQENKCDLCFSRT